MSVALFLVPFAFAASPAASINLIFQLETLEKLEVGLPGLGLLVNFGLDPQRLKDGSIRIYGGLAVRICR